MQSIYNYLLEKILLPIGDYALGTKYMYNLRKWRAISKLSEEEITEMSENNLRNILNHCINNIRFYQNKKVVPHADIIKYLNQFPIMKKKDIKDNLDDLIYGNKNKLIASSSSGSSGIQGTTYLNKIEESETRAMQTLWWEWSGWNIGKKILQMGISPNRGLIKKTKDVLFRTKYCSAFEMMDCEIEKLLNEYVGKKGYHLAGYASSLNILSRVAISQNLQGVYFDGAISWGDKLFNHYRLNIDHAFKCKVFDTYGCGEGIMMGAKKDLDYYYIMSPHVYIEIVDGQGNAVDDGQMGYVLLTRLDGYSMPLIRYYIGDLAIKLPRDKYPSNREYKFPLLEKVVGRDTDIIKTRSGKYMIVHLFTGIFEFIPEIKQFRVIQKTLDGIEIEYIKGEGFKNDIIEKIEHQIHSYLNEYYPIKWTEVEIILPTPSGKPQIIQSYLSNRTNQEDKANNLSCQLHETVCN